MQEDNANRIESVHDAPHGSGKVAGIARRSFVGILLGASASFIAAIVGTPLLRYVLYPVYSKSSNEEWSHVGDVKEFENLTEPVSKTIRFVQSDGWREVITSEPVYVYRGPSNRLQVMSAICPHLGCSVAWQPSEGRFVCPCHGGQFKPDGQHISGPPPRGLDCLQIKVEDGKLQAHFEYFRSNTPNQESVS